MSTKVKPITKPMRDLPRAQVFAASVNIFCPMCGSNDPIPAPDGSFQWTEVPKQVTCLECGKTYKVSQSIHR